MDFDKIIDVVSLEYDLPKETVTLGKHSRAAQHARQTVAFIAKEYFGYKQVEISEKLRMKQSSVSSCVRIFKNLVKRNPLVLERYENAVAELGIE